MRLTFPTVRWGLRVPLVFLLLSFLCISIHWPQPPLPLSHPFISPVLLSSVFNSNPSHLSRNSCYLIFFFLFSLFCFPNPFEIFWPKFPSPKLCLFCLPYLLLRDLWGMRKPGSFPTVLISITGSPMCVSMFSFTGVLKNTIFWGWPGLKFQLQAPGTKCFFQLCGLSCTASKQFLLVFRWRAHWWN